MPSHSNPLTCVGYGAFVVAGTAVSLVTGSLAAGTNIAASLQTGTQHYALARAELVPETGAVRYRLDGTNPTTVVGTTLDIGEQYICDSDPARLRMISLDNTVSIVHVHFFADS